MPRKLPQKTLNESWEDYSKRIRLDDIDSMKQGHIEAIKLMRDVEYSRVGYEDLDRVYMVRTIKKNIRLVFIVIGLMLFALLMYKLLSA